MNLCRRGPCFRLVTFFSTLFCVMGKTRPVAGTAGDENPFRKEPVGMCVVCVPVLCVSLCYVSVHLPAVGILNIHRFYFRAVECSKNILWICFCLFFFGLLVHFVF